MEISSKHSKPEIDKINLRMSPFTPGWQVGCLLIIKAFGNLPPDIKKWELPIWQKLCREAQEIIKQPRL